MIRYSFEIQNSIYLNDQYNIYIESNFDKIKEIFLRNDLYNYSFLRDRLFSLVKKIAFRKIGEEAQLGKKKCIPFEDRTYIRTNGDVQFCERISNYYKKTYSNLNLVETSEVIQKEFYDYKKDSCSSCIAYNFCEMCPASFLSEGTFTDQANKICENFRKEFKLALKLYVDLKEYNIIFNELV